MHGSADSATGLVRAMLDRDHADRRQLGDLVATDPSPGSALLIGELATASAARVRVVLDDLIDLILRFELATRAPMPGAAHQPDAARDAPRGKLPHLGAVLPATVKTLPDVERSGPDDPTKHAIVGQSIWVQVVCSV